MKSAEVQFEKITPKTFPKGPDSLASGHRACQGCGEVLALRLLMKALGRDFMAVSATGCMEVCTSPFPQSAWEMPWLHVAFENAAAVAGGVDAGNVILRRKGKLPDKRIPVVAIGGDGATADIGIQALSGALERYHENFIYICLDNEAYMNTGIQRSSQTPFGASTTTSPAGSHSKGQSTWKKNMPAIAVAHNIPYVATGSPAFHLDLMNKIRRAAAIPGPAYLHIYAPCPTGWRMKAELSVESSRLAVNSRIFPLYEVIDGQYILNKKVDQPIPLVEYLKPQGRFRHLMSEDIAKIEERVNHEYEYIVKLSESFVEPLF
ncbi:MAG: pyruvate ferredoxin oxidoreductase [Candidatus Adiutrix intracellularis]|jgi:pyruvate ferredoxin oxidoreductase beta subunit|nr:MAG: pyruvate ferredoxin oxidoreductase [Candidatus Adiutrix intracellularis]MDR2826749.1 pyruvate ferredoxin oxidoreductase [Candidatus Adiutrix intracellularis]